MYPSAISHREPLSPPPVLLFAPLLFPLWYNMSFGNALNLCSVYAPLVYSPVYCSLVVSLLVPMIRVLIAFTMIRILGIVKEGEAAIQPVLSAVLQKILNECKIKANATLCGLPVGPRLGLKSLPLRFLPEHLSPLLESEPRELVQHSTLSPDKTTSPSPVQAEPQESALPFSQPTPPNTLLISNDYVITLPMTQSADVKWNIESNHSSLLVRNRLRSTKHVNTMDLSEGALQILHLPNAGGNSLESEVLSFELLHRCYSAELLLTEMEIEYYPHYSKKTDYSVTIYGRPVGVSVTRAMKFGSKFTKQDAIRLLERKLFGIIVSSKNVLKRHGWDKQILHVWASHSYIADIVTEEFNKISESLRIDTLLVLTVCSSDSIPANIYTSNPAVLSHIFHSP